MEAKDKDKTLNKKGCITCGQEFDQHESVCPDDGTILTPLNDDKLVGTILADRYEVLEVIGGGGMGLVYKARHRLMNRIVAIKTLHRHLISSTETLKRFQLEAQAASCLSLPNILTIYDFGITNEGQPYMVMDYLEGTSLSDIIETEGHLSVERFLNIFSQACAGLAHAHQKGVLHRDIKPSNIMLVNYGDQADFVKIVDFGIAKLLNQNDGNGTLTRTGEVYGSPSFMSPEQCRGKELDMRSDIYSMGCVMFRSVTGHNPFSGQDIIELLFKQVSELPQSFEKLCPELGIPDELEKIILKGMAKDPSQRYQTMGEMKDAVDNLKEKLFGKAGSPAAASSAPDNVKPLWKRSGGGGSPQSTVGVGSSASLPAAAAAAATAAGSDKTAIAPDVVPPESHGEPESGAPASATASSAPRERQSSISAELDKIPTPTSRPTSDSLPSASSAPIAMGTGARAANGSNNNNNNSSSNGADPRNESAALRRSRANKNTGTPKVLVGIIAGAVAVIFVGVVIVARNTPAVKPDSETSAPLAGEQPKSGSAEDFDATAKKALQALDSGDFKGAENYAQQSIKIADAAGNDAQKAGGLTLLGRALTGESSFTNAKQALQSALTIREKKFGRASAEFAETLAYLGCALTGSGDFSEAQTNLTEALGTQKKTVGPENRAVAQTFLSLGDCFDRGGDLQRAQANYQDALTILKKVSGKWDPTLAAADLALARVFEKEKRYADAQPLAREALSIKQEILGADNPQVASLKNFTDSLAARTGAPPTPTKPPPTEPIAQRGPATPPNTGTAPGTQSGVAPPAVAVANKTTPISKSEHNHHHHHPSAGGPAPHRRRAYSSYGF